MPDYDVYVVDSAFARGKSREVLALVPNGPWTADNEDAAIELASMVEGHESEYVAFPAGAGIRKTVVFDRQPVLSDPVPPGHGPSNTPPGRA